MKEKVLQLINRIVVIPYIFKKLISIYYSLLILSFFSFAQEVDPNGYNMFYYPNGQISSEGHFEDGKPEGYWFTYYENGQVKSEGNRENHLLDSLWRFYREDGNLVEEIEYLEGMRDGKTILYNEDGLRIAEYHYVKDLKQGLGFEYYPEDQSVRIEKMFVDDQAHGLAYEFDERGRVISILEFEKGYLKIRRSVNRMSPSGKKTGVWVDFYEQLEDETERKIALEGPYSNGLKHGYFREYDRKGNLLSATKYVNGEVVVNAEEIAEVDIKRSFHSNAQVHWEKSFLNGEAHGIWKEYNDSGLIVNTLVYEHGVLLGEGLLDARGVKQGYWKEYYPSGELRAEGEYLDGARYKKWTFYFESGKKEQVGSYLSKGRQNGTWTWWYPNGEVLRKQEFARGLADGEITEYSDSGKVILKGLYFEGLEDGEWYIEVGDYKEEGSYIEGQKHGEWVHTYLSTDEVAFKGEFFEGMAHGKHTYYYDNGRRMLEGKYEMDTKVGEWKRFGRDGVIESVLKYKEGKLDRVDGRKIKP